ncbi:MAG: aminotransferase class III-fold pyridoxal phosphate-dependent enzyme [Chloroflexaceae bacterium]|nr:aminotransferase class III-fold pyridoxal phosphate-dependent enzyme [Chloroflexaceae bacterium]
MSPLTANQQQMLADNAWLHFCQMGNFVSTNARPLVLVRGEGSRLWDHEGREYLDALSGLFTVNVGYGRHEIIDAIAQQLQSIAFVSPFGFPSLPLLELAGKLAAIAPTGPASRSFFVTSGSEAVEAALKMAKAYQRKQGFPERTKVVARRGSYHGVTMGALSATGVPEYRKGFGPLVPGARHVPPPYPYRCRHCAQCSACTGGCADDFEEILEFEDPTTVAVVIMEPVQNSGGALVTPPIYIQRVRELCDHYGIVLVADEVINAFGRVGGWFGSSELGLRPDIVTVAKGITSGYAALGAVIASKQIADAFLGTDDNKFMHGSTFGGHVGSCAAALATLGILEREQLPERSRQVGAWLLQRLREVFADHPNVGDVRGKGMFIAIELVRDRETRESLSQEVQLMEWLSDQLLQHGLICRADDRMEPVIQVAPPLVMTMEELDLLVHRLTDVLHVLGRRLDSVPARYAAVPLPAASAVPPVATPARSPSIAA